MKKVIKAQLKFPISCMEILKNKKEKLINDLDDWYGVEFYDFYEGEYDNTNILGVDLVLYTDTSKEVNETYSSVKKYLKEFFGKKPEQILMFKTNINV